MLQCVLHKFLSSAMAHGGDSVEGAQVAAPVGVTAKRASSASPTTAASSPPKLVTDPNGNRQTVAFDALGMVIECDEPTADSANIDRYQHHQRGQAQVLPTQVIPCGQGVLFSQPSEHCCATQLMSYCPRFGVGRSQSRLLPHEIKGLTQ